MKKILFLSAFAFLTQGVFAQNKLEPETLWKFGRVAEPKVSPDGKTVVYQVTTYKVEDNKGNTDIWAVPVMGGEPKQLTNTVFSESNARWRPDGKKIGFLSAESGESQLWEMNIDGTEKKQISNVPGGIYNFNYSPNMKHIYFSQDIEIDLSLKKRYPQKLNYLKEKTTVKSW